MALNIQEKQAIVTKLRKVAQNSLSAVIADSCGVTVEKMTELRQASRKAGIYISVVRNTFMRRVVEGTAFECLKNTFIGPTLVAFSNDNPGAAARLFKSFAKDNTNFKLKTAAFKGEVMLAEQIDSLANMPTYDEAIYKLMATIKEASAVKLVRTLNELRGKKEAA